jgi:hypothetical protein
MICEAIVREHAAAARGHYGLIAAGNSLRRDVAGSPF